MKKLTPTENKIQTLISILFFIVAIVGIVLDIYF